MLSCRSFYSPELEFCRRSERGVPFQLAHASRHREQYDTSDILSNRTSPPSDSESKSGGLPRKRVPVACGRCRKRKIKCSGDDGNGACTNCRNAGAVHQCQFLRVNSLSQEILSHPPPRWQAGVRYNPYSMNHPGSRHNSFAIAHPYSVSGHYSAVQPTYEYNTYTGTTPGTLWARNHNGAAYGYSCDEEPSLSYSSHPAYLLPNAESTNNGSGYIGSPAGSRAWEPVAQVNRAQQTTSCGLQPVAGSLTPIGGQFVSYSHGQTTMSSESAFPGVVSSHTNMMTNDRVLPDPAASRSQSAGKITSIESVPMNLLHRSSNAWIEAMPGSSQSSTSRTLSIGLSDGSDNTARSITSSATQDIGFGFIPISDNPQEGSIQSTAIVTAAENSQSPFEYPKPSLADYDKNGCRNLSSENAAVSQEEAVAEAYGYRSENRGSRHSAHHSTSTGQLSNGQEYTRLRHEHSHVNSALEVYRQDSAACHTNMPHRASIASINNSSGY